MRTDIDLDFGDGRYLFRLTLSGIDELQRKTGAGLGELFARILAGRYLNPMSDSQDRTFGMPLEGKWKVADLIDTIRLALVGGGYGYVNEDKVEVDPIRAAQLINTYVFPARPLSEAWNLATAILTAVIEGVESDEHSVKKNSESVKTQPDDSTTAAPLETVPSPASPRKKRRRSRSGNTTH